MSYPVLKAHWRNLVVATYAAPKELLARQLPPGLELDLLDGRAHCSLVGFQFQKTSILGIPSPFYRDFPEWNLRIYVRHGDQRGVYFVREFVSHRLVSWAGRLSYNEPFVTAPVKVEIARDAGELKVDYTVHRGGKIHRLSAVGAARPECPTDDVAHFTDLKWGFGHSHCGESMRFEVHRPAWDNHPLKDFETDVDWAKLYGSEWAAMNGREPDSMALLQGSGVEVFAPKVLSKSQNRGGSNPGSCRIARNPCQAISLGYTHISG